MNNEYLEALRQRLDAVLTEMRKQTHLSGHFGEDLLPFDEYMDQLQEYIDAAEFGVAYESMVATLEQIPFALSGKSAIGLVEVALILGYKTEPRKTGCTIAGSSTANDT
jgi:hypothetical protein